MNSFNGDLYFTAGIDDSKFNVSAEAMERRVQEMSATVQSEAADMETSIQQFAQKGAEYITTFLVGKGMLDLTKSIIQVRGEFQQLEIAFETMLGSTEKANDLMAQLTRTAARTPFDLQGVAQGAKQLLAYGTAAEEVNDVLVHLGDIASGLSIPLNDLVMLYGTTMTQGRMFTQDLRQFMGRGIPIAEELAKQFGVTKDKVGELVTQGKVTSKEFNAAIMAMSSEGGKFYNLMERQSTALTGQISNLEDAWDVARNNIGKDMEGIAGDAISMATSVVENLEPILNTVRAVAIAYGSYRAALILNSLATKGETGVALIDNTVKKAKIQLLRLEEKATSGAAERIRELKKARQEEIATLESQLSAEERLNLIHQTRIANIGKVLTETQKLELRNLGLTESSEDYERIALSMMSNEQRMAVERGELTKNTGDYIAKLHEAVDVKNVNIKAIDDEIAKTQEELKFAVDYRNVVQEQVATSRDRCKSLENEISMLDLAGDSEGAAAKATEWKAEKTKLATLEEELNTAATSVNEKQTNLETLAKKRNAAATVGNATADKAATASKNLLTVATKKATLAIKTLWASMRANPLGWILTLFGAVVSVVELFKNKTDEADDIAKEFAKATREDALRLQELKAELQFASKGTKPYNDAIASLEQMAREYGVAIEDENGKLREQAIIFDELTAAVRNNTEAKLRAKYIEKYQSEGEKELENLRTTLGSRNENASLVWGVEGVREWGAGGMGQAIEGIRNLSEESTDYIHLLMVQLSEEMVETGQVTEAKAKESIDKIMGYIKEVSGISEEEAFGIRGMYERLFNDYVNAASTTRDKIAGIGNALSFSKGISNEVDIAKMSLQELEGKINDINNQLEILAAQSSRETMLPGLLLSGVEDNNTFHAPFLDRNAQLQYDRDRYQREIERREKEQHQKQLTDKEKQELEKRARARQEAEKKLNDMRIASQQAEIAAMEDGFEKRMAQLEFERKQELAKIEEDAKALKEARKKAGMSEELTQEEQNNLQSRRNSVNSKYGNSRAEMAEEEINTMREKYREYEQWVEMIGQEAADKHFRGLRDAGESFSAWVQNQITLLESKKRQNPSEFTSGDERALSSFTEASTTTDLDYYDKLKRSIEGSVEMAGTLTAKIQALRAAIEKIKNDPNLTNDQKGALGLEYAQQIINAEDENQRRFNETYKTYSQTRREMVEQYQRDIDQLIHNGDTFQAEQVKAQMKRAMGDLDTNFLKSLFGEVFSGKATTKAIRAAVKDLGNIKNMSLDEFNEKYHQNFNPEDFDQLKDKIDAVSSSLKEMGSYNIADAFKDIRDGRLEGDLERVARGTQFIQTAFQNFTSVVSALSSALNDLAEASDNENLKNTAKTVNQVSNVLGSAGQWAGMGASIGGGWGAAIGAVLGGGLGIFTEIFKSEQEKEERAAKAAEEGVEYQKMVADQLVSILGAVQSLTDTVTSLNYEQYRSTLLGLIDELEKGDNYYTNGYNGKEFWNYLYDAAKGHGASDMGWAGSSLFWGTETYPEHMSSIWKKMVDAGLISADEALQRYNQARSDSILDANAVGEGRDFWENLNNFLFSWIDHATGSYEPDYYVDQETFTKNNAESIANYLNWMAGQFEEEQKALIGRLNELYFSNSYDSLEYFNTENDVYQSQLDELRFYQSVLSILGEDTTEIDQQIRKLEHTMGESLQHMAEGLFGIDIQGLIDEWISIFEEFGDNVDVAFDKIDESVDRMVANMLQKRLIVEPMMKYFTEIFQNYEDEDGNIDEEDFYNIAQDIREGKEAFKERYMAYLEALRQADIDFDSMMGNPSTLTGSIQNVSEETAGIIAGRMNAVVINQAEGVSVMRQQLLVQYEMRNSLVAIQSDVNSIKRRIDNTATPNPYLHMGII